MVGSSLRGHAGQARVMIGRFGQECDVLRDTGNPGSDDTAGTPATDMYGKPVGSGSAADGSDADFELVGTVVACRFWPNYKNRAERSRTEYGTVDSDKPRIVVPIDEDVQAGDYLVYGEDTYHLGKPIKYPTHYEFHTDRRMEDV